MSDLVKECREACCEDYTLTPCPVGKRAADEIERLRQDVLFEQERIAAFLGERDRLRGLLRELHECGAVTNWMRVSDDLRGRVLAAIGAADQPSAALFAPRPVSQESLNAPFGPADGSGDWQGFNERRRAATPPAQPDDPIIHAQHTDTGATWSGPRSKLPKRYFECTQDLWADNMVCGADVNGTWCNGIMRRTDNSSASDQPAAGGLQSPASEGADT